ncbi:MAG: glutaredoxin domain-containing protein [Candidatus Saccharimonadales bacterium]
MTKVKIYSTTTCPYCRAEKAYLQSKNITFEDILLDKQPGQIQASLDTCGNMGVPCTHITKDDDSEVVILGFDKAKLDAALNL